MPSDANRRARAAAPDVSVKLSWICAVVAAWCVFITIRTLDERAPIGAIVALPLLLAQVPCSSVVLFYVCKHRPSGATKRWLLATALVGPGLSVVVLTVAAVFFQGGC